MNLTSSGSRLVLALSAALAAVVADGSISLSGSNKPVGTWIGHYVVESNGFRSAEDDASVSDALMRRHYHDYVKLVLDKSGSFTWRLMGPDDRPANTQPGYMAGEGFKGSWKVHGNGVGFVTTHQLSNFSEDAHRLSSPGYTKVLRKDFWQANFDPDGHLIRYLGSDRTAAIVFEKR